MAQKLTPQQLQRLEEPVSELALSVRTINALEKAGILSVESLLEHTPAQLMGEVANFGDKSLEEVYAALAKIGFHCKRRRKKHGKRQKSQSNQ